MSGAAIAQLPEKSVTQSSAPFQVGVHLSRAKPDSGEPDMGAIARETEDAIAGNIEQPVMTPTRGSFLAKWQPVKGATGYRLDGATLDAVQVALDGDAVDHAGDMVPLVVQDGGHRHRAGLDRRHRRALDDLDLVLPEDCRRSRPR